MTDQTDNESDDSDRNLSQLGLPQMNASFTITHSLTTMKHFDGSHPRVPRKWLKMSISMEDLQDKNMWLLHMKMVLGLYQMPLKKLLV